MQVLNMQFERNSKVKVNREQKNQRRFQQIAIEFNVKRSFDQKNLHFIKTENTD